MLGSLVIPKKATDKELSELAHKHLTTFQLEFFDYKERYTSVLTSCPMCSLDIPRYHLIAGAAKAAAACALDKYGLSELGLESESEPPAKSHKRQKSSVAELFEAKKQKISADTSTTGPLEVHSGSTLSATTDSTETSEQESKSYSKDPSALPPIPRLFTHGAVPYEDVDRHQFKLLNRGTHVGTFKSPSGDREIGIVVHVIEFADMDKELMEVVCQIAGVFHDSMKYGSVANSNAAWKAAGKIGKMVVAGFTGGYTTGVTAHMYTPPPIVRKPGEFQSWVGFQEQQSFLRESFNILFEMASKRLVDQIQSKILELEVPIHGNLSSNFKEHLPGLGANITVSKKLTNQMHIDNDGLNYALGLFLFADRNGNLITDRELIMSSMKGGYFIWPELHLGIDPSKCTGIVLYIWRGVHNRHGTVTQVQVNENVIRYGCSIQVNKRLIAKIRKAANPPPPPKKKGTKKAGEKEVESVCLGLAELIEKYGPKGYKKGN
ncbi:hypothetical protein FRC07_004299 [Ceratobasidium sp. 392]|nr:hypothetical protein FRC07_004299 [Ceratobasidium sp. 392]